MLWHNFQCKKNLKKELILVLAVNRYGSKKESKDCYKWTSLRGTDRKILFQKFSKFIPEIINGEQGTVKYDRLNQTIIIIS